MSEFKTWLDRGAPSDDVNEAQQKTSRREETRVDKVPMRTINASEIRRFDPEGLSFFNMNTPAAHAVVCNPRGEVAGLSQSGHHTRWQQSHERLRLQLKRS